MHTLARVGLALAVLAAVAAAVALRPAVDLSPARAEAALRASFATAPAGWLARISQDETMQACSAHRNSPPPPVAAAIRTREMATIVYPSDGRLVGDWKKGEAAAQNGYGMRFTDDTPQRANGGNCYACHQLDPKEVSFGTVGPSLKAYGKARNFAAAETRAVYEKIYNSHVAHPCSLMPRLGAGKILTIEQIKDIVALLMDPASPVNQ